MAVSHLFRLLEHQKAPTPNISHTIFGLGVYGPMGNQGSQMRQLRWRLLLGLEPRHPDWHPPGAADPGPTTRSQGRPELHGDPWSSMELHGTPWSSMEIHGDPWSSMELHGAPWSSMELHGAP